MPTLFCTLLQTEDLCSQTTTPENDKVQLLCSVNFGDCTQKDMTCSKSRIQHKQLLFEGACDEAAILCTIYMILHDVAISGCFCCLHSILASFVSEIFLEDGVHVQPIVTCMRLITCLLLLQVICSCTLPFITCA